MNTVSVQNKVQDVLLGLKTSTEGASAANNGLSTSFSDVLQQHRAADRVGTGERRTEARHPEKDIPNRKDSADGKGISTEVKSSESGKPKSLDANNEHASPLPDRQVDSASSRNNTEVAGAENIPESSTSSSEASLSSTDELQGDLSVGVEEIGLPTTEGIRFSSKNLSSQDSLKTNSLIVDSFFGEENTTSLNVLQEFAEGVVSSVGLSAPVVVDGADENIDLDKAALESVLSIMNAESANKGDLTKSLKEIEGALGLSSLTELFDTENSTLDLAGSVTNEALLLAGEMTKKAPMAKENVGQLTATSPANVLPLTIAINQANGTMVQAVTTEGPVVSSQSAAVVNLDGLTSSAQSGSLNTGMDERSLLARWFASGDTEKTASIAQDKTSPTVVSAAKLAESLSIVGGQNRTSGVLSTSVNTPVGQPQWNTGVAEKVLWMASKGIKEAEIQLDPPELGPMQVKVSVSHDQASVSFVVNNSAVREALDQGAYRLREMFAEEGVDLTHVDVSDQSSQQQSETDEDAAYAKSKAGAKSSEEDGAMVGSVETGLGRIDHYV